MFVMYSYNPSFLFIPISLLTRSLSKLTRQAVMVKEGHMRHLKCYTLSS